VTLAFLLNSSAYDGEIFRAGIASVGRGQMETARSTDLAAAFHLGLLWSRVRLSSRLERRLAT
jgi:ABC-type arginine/histidine transport system permease subunit